VFSKVLFYVRENYLDLRLLNMKGALLGALDAVALATPEMFVTRGDESPTRTFLVTVEGHECRFSLEHVDAAWTLRSALQTVLHFVQTSLPPLSPERAGQRLLVIETAASNGMLQTLDAHSLLLDAEIYGGMRAAPRGGTAGIGIAIAIDDAERVTVVAVSPGGPAERAGIVARDHLVEVDGAPTAHMNLETVMEHLRGELDSPVSLLVQHAGTPGDKKFVVARARVQTSSLATSPRVLPGPRPAEAAGPKIGYVHLVRLQSGAASEIKAALSFFEREQVGGIVLDLRDNQGGLFEQASEVVDAFARDGVTVSMVGGGKRHDETAHDDGDEPATPVVVLVNRRSAAGAEIVAAGLRSLAGALVVGERTAGAGSVQVLFDIMSPLSDPIAPAKLGLKLTTAGWLGADRTSVQGLGLVPDVWVPPRYLPTPASVASGKALTEVPGEKREGELPGRFATPVMSAPRPIALSAPFFVDPDGSELPTTDGDDVQLELAREVLARVGGRGREALMSTAELVAEAASARQQARAAASLAALGIDWSLARSAAADGRADFQLAVGQAGKAVKAGDLVELRGTVTNKGAAPLNEVRASLSDATGFFEGRTMLFGRIEPGASRTVQLVAPVPLGSPALDDTIHGRLEAQSYLKAPTADVWLHVAAIPRPHFTVAYEATPLPKTSTMKLTVKVKNDGAGPAPAFGGRLTAATEHDGITIGAGRMQVGELSAGHEATLNFDYQATPGRKSGPHSLDLTLWDSRVTDGLSSQVRIDEASTGSTVGTLTPPVLRVSAPTHVDAAKALTVRLTGTADDGDGLSEVWIIVQNATSRRWPRKVMAQAGAGARHVSFEAEVPLWLGSNLVSVIARDTRGTQSTSKVAVLLTLP
jgi:carboxyl-terminal processing protease